MAGLAGLPTCRPDHGSDWPLGITVSNLPAAGSVVALQQQFDTFQQNFNAFQQQANQDRQQANQNHQQLVGMLRDMQNEQHLLPMRLYNASTSEMALLCYPAGVPQDQLPRMRRDLMLFTREQLQAASAVLGLPALPNNAYVDERRMQIANYLGVPLYI
ncbi:hypothetical protein L873DRAFT_1776343 [Choiromyces venosus 120613-1]|uniref:Uncharacterized protein n=1 Tax=Choiromyces venosus 120613-1 TaxID=1336337 RepID=A0A3N4J7V1_9PEZI|nr:hypothetical protein L873DRAFT_1776343 [Choiromyces venosus 120613-1]